MTALPYQERRLSTPHYLVTADWYGTNSLIAAKDNLLLYTLAAQAEQPAREADLCLSFKAPHGVCVN